VQAGVELDKAKEFDLACFHIRNRKQLEVNSHVMVLLKPQDTLLALKYWSLRLNGQHASVRELAESLAMSPSEASKGAKRLLVSGLLVDREGVFYAEANALFEWLSYGVRYAFPAQTLGFGRGMGTAWNCSLIKAAIVPPVPGHVWASASASGTQEGIFVKPIYAGVPLAAFKDEQLYKALALVDAVRLGKPRELVVARESLKILLTGKRQ